MTVDRNFRRTKIYCCILNARKLFYIILKFPCTICTGKSFDSIYVFFLFKFLSYFPPCFLTSLFKILIPTVFFLLFNLYVTLNVYLRCTKLYFLLLYSPLFFYIFFKLPCTVCTGKSLNAICFHFLFR